MGDSPDTYCAGCGKPQSDDQGVECIKCRNVYCAKCAPENTRGDHGVLAFADQTLCEQCIAEYGGE